jgi:hypothetical protein
MEELGLPSLSAGFNKSLPQSTTQMGENQETIKLIMKIRIRRSIALTRIVKEIVMMMTLNLMSSQNPWQLRCSFYLQISGWGMIKLDFDVFHVFYINNK